MESFQKTSAARPVDDPLHPVEARWRCERGSNIHRLNSNFDNLIANGILELSVTLSKQTMATPPNREKLRVSLITPFLTATVANSEIGPSHSKHWTSPFSIRNKNAVPVFQLLAETFYLEPAGGVTCDRLSNRNKVRIEIAVTYSKQRIAFDSNRNKFRGPRISSSNVLAAPGEFSTARQRVAVKFAGLKNLRPSDASVVGPRGITWKRRNSSGPSGSKK